MIQDEISSVGSEVEGLKVVIIVCCFPHLFFFFWIK